MPVSCTRETNGRLSRPHTAGYSHRTALPAPVVEAKEKLVNDRHPSGTATSRLRPPMPSRRTMRRTEDTVASTASSPRTRTPSAPAAPPRRTSRPTPSSGTCPATARPARTTPHSGPRPAMRHTATTPTRRRTTTPTPPSTRPPSTPAPMTRPPGRPVISSSQVSPRKAPPRCHGSVGRTGLGRGRPVGGPGPAVGMGHAGLRHGRLRRHPVELGRSRRARGPRPVRRRGGPGHVDLRAGDPAPLRPGRVLRRRGDLRPAGHRRLRRGGSLRSTAVRPHRLRRRRVGRRRGAR